MLVKKKKHCLAMPDLGGSVLQWFWLFLEGRFPNGLMGFNALSCSCWYVGFHKGSILFPVLCRIYVELPRKFVQRLRLYCHQYPGDTQLYFFFSLDPKESVQVSEIKDELNMDRQVAT